VKNSEGSIISYQGRAISPSQKPRYKNIENEKMAQDPLEQLYGIEKIRDAAIIVEGPTDVWRLGPGAVATFGIDWSMSQANILRKIPRRYIAFDPDERAQQRALQLAEWLSYYPGETEIIEGLDCDPGDHPEDEAQKIMEDLGIPFA
jgi:DNA primase